MIPPIDLTPKAAGQYARLGKNRRALVREAIDGLAEEPHPEGVSRLGAGEGECRIRVGDLRVVYETVARRLIVLAIGRDGDVYPRR